MDGINSGDTAWILVSTALVVMMTPALAFFYGGMIRRKNILSTLNMSVIMMGVISLQWVLFGYSLAFGDSIGGFVGGLNFLGLSGVGAEPTEGSTIPHLLFAAFQMTFAVITPALITGAFVERVRFRTFLVFSVIWATLVYDPVAHWAWGGGIFGAIRPHNIVYTVLGAGLLWVGWFGFNGGSALAADGVAVLAIVNTNTAAAAAMVVWMLLAWNDNKPSVLGMVTGAVCGLVAITPAAGFVTPISAIIIGGLAAPVSYFTIRFRENRGLDESLDVWACHGMSGTWGAVATGIFASTAANPGGADGLLNGDVNQFVVQIIAVVIAIVYSFVITIVLAKTLDAIMGLSVSEQEEEVGLDISEHGERAYS